MLTRLSILFVVFLVAVAPAHASSNLTPVDDSDTAALEASASRAFYRYLQSIDDQQVEEANEQVLDPVDPELRLDVIDRLQAFMRARAKSPVRNEALITRFAGDWALVVYQYDTTIAGKTARVITTAWMVRWEGYWRQFIVAPTDTTFWEARRSDYERLQRWFDDHAEELVSQA